VVFSLFPVSSFLWLGLHITNNLKTLWALTVSNAKKKKKIQIGYSKIVANRGRYNRKALGKLYSSFCDHSILFLSGFLPILKPKDLKSISTYYFKCSWHLLCLPPWFQNQHLILQFGLPDLQEKVTVLAGKMLLSAGLTVYHNLSHFM
jgi:hypothetical protein